MAVLTSAMDSDRMIGVRLAWLGGWTVGLCTGELMKPAILLFLVPLATVALAVSCGQDESATNNTTSSSTSTGQGGTGQGGTGQGGSAQGGSSQGGSSQGGTGQGGSAQGGSAQGGTAQGGTGQGGSGQGGGGSPCAIHSNDTPCQVCAKTNCCYPLTTCYANPDCQCVADCALGGGSISGCMQQCAINGFPSGLQPLLSCVGQSCAQQCTIPT